MTFHQIKWTGEQITVPGIYSNMSLDDYHHPFICSGDTPLPDGHKIEGITTYGPSISSSGLRTIFNKSPAHFYAEWGGNPKRIARDDAEHFRVGRAVHHLMLGEKNFSKLFAVQPAEYEVDHGQLKPWNNNAHKCRAWNRARAAEGRAVLTKADVISIKNMVISLENNAIVQAGALNGLIERSLFWKDPKTGIWLKSRPDSIPGGKGPDGYFISSEDFVDLKTTFSVQWRDMMRTVAEFGYHQQGSLVCEGARTLLGIKHPTFTLIFVEKKQPYCNQVVTVKENDLKLGNEQNGVALSIFAECLKKNHWPGPGGDRQDAMQIEIGERDRKAIEDRIRYGI